jgi:hypothetical protein
MSNRLTTAGTDAAAVEKAAMLAVSAFVASQIPAMDDPTPDDLEPHARLKSAVRRLRAQGLSWEDVLERLERVRGEAEPTLPASDGTL